jgi:hypothetical protein
MAQQTLLSAAGFDYKTSLFAQLPSWFDKKGCKFTEGPTDVYLYFSKACSCGKAKQSVSVGKTKGTERAAMLAAAVSRVHEKCQTAAAPQTDEEVIAVAQSEIARLNKAVNVQRQKATQFEAQSGLLKRKVADGQQLKTQAATDKRLKTIAKSKRAPIVRSNEEAFGAGMLSHRMLAPADLPGGVVPTLEYHCEGSHAKLLDVVLYLINRYHLTDEVAAVLCAGADNTNKYIVQRARAALADWELMVPGIRLLIVSRAVFVFTS